MRRLPVVEDLEYVRAVAERHALRPPSQDRERSGGRGPGVTATTFAFAIRSVSRPRAPGAELSASRWRWSSISTGNCSRNSRTCAGRPTPLPSCSMRSRISRSVAIGQSVQPKCPEPLSDRHSIRRPPVHHELGVVHQPAENAHQAADAMERQAKCGKALFKILLPTRPAMSFDCASRGQRSMPSVIRARERARRVLEGREHRVAPDVVHDTFDIQGAGTRRGSGRDIARSAPRLTRLPEAA